MSDKIKTRRKPPRGGHRAGMRRDAFWRRIRLAALIVVGGAVAAALVYVNLRR